MLKRWLVAAVAAGAAVFGPDQAPASAAPASGCRKVMVIDAASGRPLGGIEDIAVNGVANTAYLSADDRWTVEDQAARRASALPQGGVYALPLDDEAWLVAGVVRKARVLIVTPGNVVLRTFFDLDENARAKVLKSSAEKHLAAEIHAYVPDAWIDHAKTKVGYEIPFNRYFYRYTPPRPLEEIDAELQQLGREIMELLAEVAA